MSDGYNIKVGVDSRPAERGVKTFTTSLNESLRALRDFDAAARNAFKALDQFSKINTSKLDKSMQGVARAVQQLNQIKVNKKVANDLRDLGKALNSIKFNGSDSLGKLPTALAGLSKIKIDTKIVAQLNDLKAAMKGFSGPPKSLAEWPRLLNGVGRVQINAALAKQLVAIKAAMKGFIGPSRSAMQLPAFLKGVSAASINPSVASNVAKLKTAFAGFTGPSAASARNFKALIDAFKGASASEINKIASALAKLNGMNLRVSQSALRMSQSMGQVNKSSRAAANGLRQFHQDSMNLQTALGMVQAALGGMSVTQFAKGIYEVGSSYQSLQRTLIAVASSPDEVRSHLEFLNSLTQKMPISIEVATESFKKFAAATRLSGVSAKDTQDVFESFSMGFAAMGVDAEHSRHAFMALEQIFSKGTVTSEELKQQLGEHLPGAVSMLADALGTTTAEMFKMMEQGKLTSDAILKMSAGMKEKFGPAAKAAMESSGGAIMQLSNEWTKFQKVIFNNGFESALGAMAKSLADTLASANMQELAKDIGEAFSRLFRAIAVGARIMADNKDLVIGFMKAFAAWAAIGATGAALRMLVAPLTLLGPLVSAASIGFRGLGAAMAFMASGGALKAVMAFFDFFTKRIFLAVAGVAALSGAVYTLIGYVDELAGTDMQGSIDSFGNGALDAARKVVTGITDMTKNIGGDFMGSVDGINAEFDKIQKQVAGANDELTKMETTAEQMRKNAADEAKRAQEKNTALTSEEQKLWDQLNPLAAATKEYEEQLKLIDEIARKRGLSPEQVSTAKATLAAQTLEDRNPVAASVQDMQNQLNAAKAVTAEQKAQNEALLYQQEMLKKGVTVTEEMKKAVYDFHMGMSKMAGEAGNGFERWAASVKDWNDSMQDAIKDGISGLSDELTNFVTGAEYDFRALAQSILRSFVKIQIDSLMKDMFTGLGLNGMVNGQDQAQSALAALSKMGGTIQTAQTNVYTSGLTVNGQPLAPAQQSVTDAANNMGLRPGLDVNGNSTANPTVAAAAEKWDLKPTLPANATVNNITNTPLRAGLDTNGVSTVHDFSKTVTDNNRVIKMTPEAEDWKFAQQAAEEARAANALKTPVDPSTTAAVTPTSTTGLFATSDWAKQPGSAIGNFNDMSPRIQSDLMNDLGLTKEQASGIVGNFAVESKNFSTMQEIKPTVAGSKGGWGWAQWTGYSKNNPRRKEFEEWADSQGLPRDSYAANYGFMKHEFQGSEKSAFNKIQSSTTVDEATLNTMKYYERPGVKHLDRRQAYADKAYAQPVTPPESIPDPVTTNSIPTTPTDSSADALNQAMPSLDKLKTSVADMGVKAQTTATQQTTALQQTTQASQSNALSQQAVATQVQTAGLNAQQASPQFQQAGQSIQQAGQNAQMAGTQAQSSTSGLNSMTSGLSSMTAGLSSAIPGLSSVTQALSALGSLGGGSPLSAGLFKEGGFSGSPVSSGSMPASAWAGAPHYAEGTANTSGGHPAILHDNEAVIPLSRGREVPVKINSTDDDESAKSEFGRVQEGRGGMSLNLHLHGVKNGDDFNKSKRQVQAAMATGAERALRRTS